MKKKEKKTEAGPRERSTGPRIEIQKKNKVHKGAEKIKKKNENGFDRKGVQ